MCWIGKKANIAHEFWRLYEDNIAPESIAYVCMISSSALNTIGDGRWFIEILFQFVLFEVEGDCSTQAIFKRRCACPVERVSNFREIDMITAIMIGSVGNRREWRRTWLPGGENKIVIEGQCDTVNPYKWLTPVNMDTIHIKRYRHTRILSVS